MSKISTYATVTPTASDKVIGTDVAGTPNDATKNFTAGSIAALAATAGVLTLPLIGIMRLQLSRIDNRCVVSN